MTNYENFFKHIGVDEAFWSDISRKNSKDIDYIGGFITRHEKKTFADVYVDDSAHTAHLREFIDFIDGNGFEVIWKENNTCDITILYT